MWRWQKIRTANLPQELRERFEFYGETLLTLASTTEPNTNILGVELAGLSRMKRDEMLAWLRERRDMETRHSDRAETVEWAILIFVVVGVIVESGLGGVIVNWLSRLF
jgi:hypothetical protein